MGYVSSTTGISVWMWESAGKKVFKNLPPCTSGHESSIKRGDLSLSKYFCYSLKIHFSLGSLIFSDLQCFSSCCSDVQLYSKTIWRHWWAWPDFKNTLLFSLWFCFVFFKWRKMKSLQFKCEKHHFGGQIIFAIVSTLWNNVEDSVFFSSCFHSKCCVKNWTAIKSISLRAWSKICTNRKPQKDFRAPKHPNLEQIKSHFPEPLNRDSECSIWGLVLVFFFFFFFFLPFSPRWRLAPGESRSTTVEAWLSSS